MGSDEDAVKTAKNDACKAVTFENDAFTHCVASPERHFIQTIVHNADAEPLRTFEALEKELGEKVKSAAFAVNGGMYDADGNAIGLLIVDGAEIKSLNQNKGPGNFHLLPNGVFYGDSKGWHVATSAVYAELQTGEVDFATQSGPMLVIDGALHPDIAHNGESRKIRNGVGIDPHGKAHMLISDSPVSFGRMARLYQKLGVQNALFLDGTVSALWRPAIGYSHRKHELGPMILVSKH
ncbi:phosphodiester glycosidase family protein [Sphingorhabdus sp. Alg239-R122]|uniref:phosphodiester glycosidase family protein n=1 Tax=Sphingorhabdus sp. Alg239-R122 TaxID=2305989 RepID=UPI0013DBFAE2|nr:phosphodiester glycosidase family protein [Sphingorhabdus sp. Alg239-R122]